MQVAIEIVSGLERRMIVGVPADQVDGEVEARLRKAAPTLRLPGFRPGKVPLKILRQRFGKGIREEVVGELIGRTFQEALLQEKLRPAGAPTIESVTDRPGEGLRYVAVFEVYPEVALADLSRLQVSRPVAEVTEADVARMVELLREQHASWEAVDRPAQAGDQLLVDYNGRRGDEALEGGAAEGVEVVLGSGQLLPAFEEGLVGARAGERRTIDVTFPEDYPREELRGQAAQFEVRVREVRERVLPELDDDFFARFGIEEGGEAKFREEVRANMERELRTALRAKLKARVMEQLLALHEVELPKRLVAEEVRLLKRRFLERLEGQGGRLVEGDIPDDPFRAEAERRVALGLIVAALVERADLRVDPERVRREVEEIAATYEEPEEVVRFYYQNPRLLEGVRAAVLEDQVVDYVLERAQVTEVPCSYEEAVRPEPRPEAGGAQAPQGEAEREQPADA
ncbi:MAG: trigger factor [Porticoccaceae bacterium]|nr:MAG: trigger factor [Porticoccaceae bacterium]